MTYRIRIKASAAKALDKIQPRDRFRILQAIDRLAVEPQAGGVLKGEFSGLRRLRVGSYRIIYEVIQGELTVLVVRVAHRREAYR
jgi:mRNA interferase RelE/StbE